MTENSKMEQSESQGLAIASLVLGILAIITCLVPYISIALGVIAIILGVISVKTKGRKKAISGIVTGSVGVVLAIIVPVMTFVALPALQKNQRDIARKMM